MRKVILGLVLAVMAFQASGESPKRLFPVYVKVWCWDLAVTTKVALLIDEAYASALTTYLASGDCVQTPVPILVYPVRPMGEPEYDGRQWFKIWQIMFPLSMDPYTEVPKFGFTWVPYRATLM